MVQELVRVMVTSTESPINPLIPPFEFFSTWERLVQNVDAVYRFIDIMRRKKSTGRITE